jgi:outer membrane protein assembly factor BamB
MQSTHAPLGLSIALALAALAWSPAARADDQPQWGQAGTRNMVSDETDLPEWFDPGKRDFKTGNIDLESTVNVKWVARAGDITYGTPIVAGGRVFLGTNNFHPRDERITDDRGVLMCFDEATGRFQWQLNLPKMTWIKWSDWRGVGITSPPTVDGDRLYLVSNRAEVMCLDVDGMADGNDGPFTDEGQLTAGRDRPALEVTPHDADVIWLFDMPAKVKAQPHNAANCSVLVRGDLLYVCTSNGVEWTHNYVVHPEAPSVIVLDKNTGKMVARDAFGIGPDITHGQWSSVAAAEVGGRPLGFFGAGNGVLYAFDLLRPEELGEETALLKPRWRFFGHPLAQTQDDVPPDHQHDSTSYQVTAMPVFHNDRIYLTFTQEPFHRMKLGWLCAIDATQTGDVTRKGLLWSYDEIGSSTSTVAVADGLVYAAGFDGRLHCLDADSGEVYWVHDTGDPISGSPLVADGKVYLGTDGRAFWVLRAGKELEVISRIRLRDRMSSTPTAANGVLYLSTWKHLYAVDGDQPPPEEEGR